MTLTPKPLTAEDFAPFGQIIEATGNADFEFNEGRADRWHNRIHTNCDDQGKVGISVCVSRPIVLPYELRMMERHPLGSQAFVPMTGDPFVVFVALDKNGAPDTPIAFITNGKQGINYNRNTWHGVLSPYGNDQQFLIIDRVKGEGSNLVEHHFETPYRLENVTPSV